MYNLRICVYGDEVGIDTHSHSNPNVRNTFVILSTPEPNPPVNVTITQTTCNTITVHWTPPADNGKAAITQYRVLVYKDSGRHVTHTNDTTMQLSHQVTSLEPKTDYTVEVQAGNVGGFGNGTSTKFTTGKLNGCEICYSATCDTGSESTDHVCGETYVHNTCRYSIRYAYTFIQLFCPTNVSGKTPITVLAEQSTNVNITINGRGEVYNCTLNNQKVNITAGQPVQLTGLAPNTTYTINCHSVDGSCLEATATFTTGTV